MKGARILAVDDEADILRFIHNALTLEGFEVITAYDGLSAIDAAFELRPDMILLDIMMPVMNGFEVCRKLKSDPQTQDIPIIFISSAYAADTVRQGREAGGAAYIVKPFAPGELVEKIRDLLREKP